MFSASYQIDTDCPNLFRSQWRFLAEEFVLIPGCSEYDRRRHPRKNRSYGAGVLRITTCLQSLWIVQDLFNIYTSIGNRVVTVPGLFLETTLE